MNQNTKTALIIGGIVLALLVVVPLLSGGLSGWQGGGMMGGQGGMMGPGMMGGFGWGWFGPLFMVLFWGLIIWGVVALARGVSGPGSPGPSYPDSAMAVLKRRYARGDISKEEYEEKKRDLA